MTVSVAHLSPTLSIVNLLNVSHSSACGVGMLLWGYLFFIFVTVVLICISLMIVEIEHLFMCHLSTHVSSFVEYLVKSCVH